MIWKNVIALFLFISVITNSGFSVDTQIIQFGGNDEVSMSHFIPHTAVILDVNKWYTTYGSETLKDLKYEYWITIVLISILVLLIYTIYSFRKQVSLMFNSLLDRKVTDLIQRENRIVFQIYLTLLSIVFVLIAGYFLYLMIQYFAYPTNSNGLTLYSFCVLVVTAIYFIKYVSGILIFTLIPRVEAIKSYHFNVMLINRILGIILIPILITATYAQEKIAVFMIFTAIVIVTIALIFRYVRGFLMARTYLRFFKFYFFVYFCTLEIAPVLVIVKISTLKIL